MVVEQTPAIWVSARLSARLCPDEHRWIPVSDHGLMNSDAAPVPTRPRKWSDLSKGQQRAVILVGIIQVGLATAAWVDLARRPATQVRGPKAAWAAVIAVNFIGPVSYFAWGRRATPSQGHASARRVTGNLGAG